MKSRKITLSVDQLFRHQYHEKVYDMISSDYLERSLKDTDNKPVNPIIVVPMLDSTVTDFYWVISGVSRLETLKRMGIKEVEISVYDIDDEDKIKTLIVDLNKQRVKTGRELLNEFRHYMEMYPPSKGKRGNRYTKIGKELGRSKYRVKDWVILNNFFQAEGDCLLEKMFGDELHFSDLKKIQKVVDKYPERFKNEGSFEKLGDRGFDFDRLDYSLQHLDHNQDDEWELVKIYLNREVTPTEFNQKLASLGRIKKIVDDHNSSKVVVPDLTIDYHTEHTYLLKGDNREVQITSPFTNPVRCIVGSPPYGHLRLNGDDADSETGHGLTGYEYGKYLSETYERYKNVLAPDGSIYVIIDDFQNKDGSHSCSLEYFVVEMLKKGFHLVGRYSWEKMNPIPRSYKTKKMVNGFEMVYRFALDPYKYYTNPDIFLELREIEIGFNHGCTNTDNKGKTTHGGQYYQSHLKKLRNTLSHDVCKDIIRGNVANPEKFFMEAGDKRHTSTCPPYLTSVLILESTKNSDVVLDIWNGVGNSMTSALLLGRDYIGVEKEENFFNQTCKRACMTEEMLEDARKQDPIDKSKRSLNLSHPAA